MAHHGKTKHATHLRNAHETVEEIAVPIQPSRRKTTAKTRDQNASETKTSRKYKFTDQTQPPLRDQKARTQP